MKVMKMNGTPHPFRFQRSEQSEENKGSTFSVFLRDLDHRGKGHHDGNGADEQECCNCEVTNIAGNAGPMHSTPKGILCDECFLYWQKSGLMRPELYPSKSSVKKIKRPPKNMALDLDSILLMNSYDQHSTSNENENEIQDPIDKLEEDIRLELATIQSQNQKLELLTAQAREGMEQMRIPFLSSSSSPYLINNSNATSLPATSTWSTEEILLAIQAFAKYGKDFDTVARIIGPSKTLADVETFFLECRERYQLDTLVELNSKPTGNNSKKATNNDLNSKDIVFVN